MKAFAELVQHVSAFNAAYEPQTLLRGTFQEVSRTFEGIVIAPSDLLHFSASQRLEPLLDSLTPESSLTWLAGVRISTGEPALVPALVAFMRWKKPPEEPLFLRPGDSGLAAHTDEEEATKHAVFEVLERDALMMSWRVPGWPCVTTDASSIPEPLFAVCEALGLVPRACLIGTVKLPPTVLVLLSRPDGSELTCGSACGEPGPDMIGRAVCEALALQWTMRCNTAVQRLLGDIPTDTSTVNPVPKTDLGHVLRGYFGGEEVGSWYAKQTGGSGAAPGSEILAGPVGSSRSQRVRELAGLVEEELGGYVIVIDVTDRIGRNSGWYVRRAVVTNALPRESDHRLAHLGGPRIEAALGLQDDEPLNTGTGLLNPMPHPFG